MDITVKLPSPTEITGGQQIKSFLRHLELSVHHLQKSVEQMEKDGTLTDETYIKYDFPDIEYDKYYEIFDNCLQNNIGIQIYN